MRIIAIFITVIMVLFTAVFCPAFDDASKFTKKTNSEWYSRLDFSDVSETLGLIKA